MTCYNCQGQRHMVCNCHNPCVPHQQVQQMEEVPAQGARIEEVKELMKEEKEKKADKLRAQLKALGFWIGMSLVLSTWPKDYMTPWNLVSKKVSLQMNILFYKECSQNG